MRFTLPSNVEYIISTMEKSGYRAHIVGGSVRDFLLGKAPDDFDITTDATPDETKRVFSDHRTVDTGIKHGTVSLILDGKPYEITTYRVDGEYKDSRHPENVSFTRKIEEDLARRDFTVNAMAYSPREGIIDPFGGRSDLESRIIRAVGEPDLRFSEDALRILRGIRFSATLGFEIEAETDRALREKAHLLKNVSAERIYIELRKTISAAYAYEVIEKYSDILSDVTATLDKIKLPDRERFTKADYVTRLLSIFALSSDTPADSFEKTCRHLHTDNHIRELGCAVLANMESFDFNSDIALTYALRKLGSEATEELVKLEILLGKADETSLAMLEKLLADGACYRICDLVIGGSDLIALGFSGREIGSLLEIMLDMVINKKLPNVSEKLINFAENQAKIK